MERVYSRDVGVPDPRAAFVSRVTNLGLSSAVEEFAWEMVQRTVTSETEEKKRNVRETCAIYVAKCLGRVETVGGGESKNAGVPLSSILKACGVPVVDFVRELRHFALQLETLLTTRFGGWEAMEQRVGIKQLELSLLFACTLRTKYHEVARTLFKKVATPDDFLRFGWLLFIIGKYRLLSSFPSMVDQVFLFVAVIEVLMANCADARMRSPSDMTVPSGDPLLMLRDSTGLPDSLASLSAYCKAPQADVQAMLGKVVDLLKDLFPGQSFTRVEARRTVACTAPRFECLVDEAALHRHVKALDKMYEAHYMSTLEIDERIFHDGEPTALGDPKNLTPARVGSRQPRASTPGPGVQAVPDVSPIRLRGRTGGQPGVSSPNPNGLMVPPRTPMSETMSVSSWLRREVEQIEGSASSRLVEKLNSIDEQAAAVLNRRIEGMVETVFPSEPRRRVEASKLYWKWLDLMVQNEQDRGASEKHLLRTLRSQTFHRALLACSIELIVASYKMPELVFPTVSKRLGLEVFEMSKVIGSFVRAEGGLPRELKRHFNDIEERILETLAWQRGSSLYTELEAACAIPSDARGQLTHMAGAAPGPSTTTTTGDVVAGQKPTTTEKKPPYTPGRVHSAFQAFDSPAPGVRHTARDETKGTPLPACFGPSDLKEKMDGATGAEAALRLFFRKVSTLASLRVAEMCEQLRLPDEMMHIAYGVVVKVLYEHTRLLYNRHLDQIILCSIYGVCKTQLGDGIKRQFKDIITAYQKSPQCRQEVFRSVVLDQTDPGLDVTRKGSIIDYYNMVFIPDIKTFLLGLRDSAVAGCAGDATSAHASPGGQAARTKLAQSPLPTFPSDVRQSPVRVQKGSNIFVSPLRSRLPEMTPRTRSLIAFVGESSSAYRTPGSELDDLNGRIKSRTVSMRLDLDRYASRDAQKPAAAEVMSEPLPFEDSPGNKRARM